ncbi:hypothetical protein ASE65_10510 [Sphingomonas sp. Leaf16]|nr:hypothetical protein ASE65_10510 [Sphingomonas sp. Leaf16]KQN11042.1 hypothetical protein ASE81_11495 [Sphingomonas sp. Leaf29]KQN18344.1 hypothetical protein ASE83_11435 [Sphingomonas sp. Leaf32]
MHRDSDGSETLYSAETVRHIPDRGDADGFANAGIRIDETPEGVRHLIPSSRSGSTADVCRPCVFVMNRHGATVARYDL